MKIFDVLGWVLAGGLKVIKFAVLFGVMILVHSLARLADDFYRRPERYKFMTLSVTGMHQSHTDNCADGAEPTPTPTPTPRPANPAQWEWKPDMHKDGRPV